VPAAGDEGARGEAEEDRAARENCEWGDESIAPCRATLSARHDRKSAIVCLHGRRTERGSCFERPEPSANRAPGQIFHVGALRDDKTIS
jgi:hypothetical protein